MTGKKIRSCRTYAFFGSNAGMYSRFATAVLSSEQDKRVLILDAAKNRSLFISAAERDDCTAVSLRFADYTCDVAYALSRMDQYDYFVIRDDFSEARGAYDKYCGVLDMVYLCLGADKYSLTVFRRAIQCFNRYAEIPYDYIFAGTEENAARWKAKEYWRYVQQCRRGPQKVYYIPSDTRDFNGFLNLEYGALCMKSLSGPMQDFLEDLMNFTGMDENLMGRVASQTMFCL